VLAFRGIARTALFALLVGLIVGAIDGLVSARGLGLSAFQGAWDAVWGCPRFKAHGRRQGLSVLSQRRSGCCWALLSGAWSVELQGLAGSAAGRALPIEIAAEIAIGWWRFTAR